MKFPPPFFCQKQFAFACQRSPSEIAANDDRCPNRDVIEILSTMQKKTQSKGDQWREMAYRKAIVAIRKYPKRIETMEEARSIPGVGTRISEKVIQRKKERKKERKEKRED
jgi:DNA polymerase/3'-5' exonuclease PolX